MRRKISLLPILGILFILALVTPSCKSGYMGNLYDPKQVTEVSQRLGIPLQNTSKEDDKNMQLYGQCALWIGTPYRYGGISKRGIDCSGLVANVYKDSYKMKIGRTTDELVRKSKNISKNNLDTGDLVFFATSKKKRKITHVGIYLKDGYFIHASTTRGVVVNHLNENYYCRNWIRGGRIKR